MLVENNNFLIIPTKIQIYVVFSRRQYCLIWSMEECISHSKTESTTDLTPTPPVEEEREIEKSPSQRFIKYDKEVGRGSFKTVYKALDTVHAQPVAWLELQPHKLTKEDRNRFKVVYYTQFSIFKT